MAISRPTVTNSAGTPTTGTLLNAAFFTSLFDAIENWGLDTYTPAWTGSVTNPAIGNGTRSGKYIEIGDLVIGAFTITAGSTTTYGSGSYSISLPVTASVTWPGMIQVFARDASAGGAIYGGVGFVATTTTALLLTQATPAVNWTTTVPITFATSDVLQGMFVYLRA